MNFTSADLGNLFRSFLKIGGTITACTGIIDPHLGQAVGDAFTAIGSFAASVGVIWSFVASRYARGH